ncbi:CYFA0S01e09758g1_1 [Cyberlindnera fabianii]|uniref:NADPH:adrenodoxin oxidoreductase, mitochondrial n=1 Tax=Cyberlindnera fabianii TaxID=36022 RepID=A0A061APN8_CYBFA|nr:CYFA0S01e09758g1_1 [Cyberlindnera fabianii]
MLRTLRPRMAIVSPTLHRLQSTLNVAIVGSGPSGFYTAHDLLKRPNVKVTIFDKLPTPFGLSRYGVAPDHLEVKNCEDTFTEAASSDRFAFRGNVEVGKDVTLQELHERFNSVVLAYGCDRGNRLGIEGEDLPGVINAHEFVGWYNGNPDTETVRPPLEDVEKLVIIGNGNVAMDIARLLLMPAEEVEKSDIAEHAIRVLKKSKVNDIKIVARRGFLESAFATKEIRELLQLEKYGVKFQGIDHEVIELLIPIKNKLERVQKRKLETLLDYMKPDEERRGKKKFQIPDKYTKSWKLEYLLSPTKVTPNPTNPKLVSEITFQQNVLYHEDPESPAKVEAVPNQFKTFKADLVVTSLGFKGRAIPGLDKLGIKFDARKGTIASRDSRVLNEAGVEVPGIYAAGWIKNSKRGPILTTFVDSDAVAQSVIADFENGVTSGDKVGVEGLEIEGATDWKDWENLNKFELEFGKLHDKARWKVPEVTKMLEIIRDGSGSKEDKIAKFKEWLESYQ